MSPKAEDLGMMGLAMRLQPYSVGMVPLVYIGRFYSLLSSNSKARSQNFQRSYRVGQG